MPLLRSLLIALLLAAAASAEEVTVGAAISLREAMEEIAALYRKDTGDEVRLTFGSSGQIMGQVRGGAPIDVFVSAAQKQVDELAEAGLVVAESRRVIAGNVLVLVVPQGAEAPPRRFEELAEARVRRIAIGEPKTVPAGSYAQQVFQRLGLTEALRERLVYGANVRQVLSYVERGEVDAGVVYRTDALGAEEAKVVAAADAKRHEPIVYPAVVVKASRAPAAHRFLNFLGGDAARAVLRTKGFADPPTPSATAPAGHEGRGGGADATGSATARQGANPSQHGPLHE